MHVYADFVQTNKNLQIFTFFPKSIMRIKTIVSHSLDNPEPTSHFQHMFITVNCFNPLALVYSDLDFVSCLVGWTYQYMQNCELK